MARKTRVIVTIKKDVLDPAGVAVKKALARQGLENLEDVRIGKVIDISFRNGRQTHENSRLLTELAKDILSNPLMEDHSIQFIDESTDER